MERLSEVSVVGQKRLAPGECFAVLTEREAGLLTAVNQLDFGRIERLEVHEGQPHQVELKHIVRRVRL